MEISESLSLLGVFEDRAQEEFVSGLLESAVGRLRCRIVWTRHLTGGCRYDALVQGLRDQASFHGVVLGVDAGRRTAMKKRDQMQRRISRDLGEEPQVPKLWAIASPSIEEWMMADQQAFPSALESAFGRQTKRGATRPGMTSAERTAKSRLADWAEQLLGDSLLDGGLAYARETGRRTRMEHIGSRRNSDLHRLLHDELGPFFQACSARQAAS